MKDLLEALSFQRDVLQKSKGIFEDVCDRERCLVDLHVSTAVRVEKLSDHTQIYEYPVCHLLRSHHFIMALPCL